MGDFPRRGLMPDGLRRCIRQAGWPTATVTVSVTQLASVDAAGWHRPERVQQQEVVIVPEQWLRRFAELVGRRLAGGWARWRRGGTTRVTLPPHRHYDRAGAVCPR